MLTLSNPGIKLLKSLEGLGLQIYFDAAGIPTMGYGHVIREGENTKKKITELEAAILLKKDLARFTKHVWECCEDGGRIPSQTQFDAMVIFAFNIGKTGFLRSTVLRRFVNHDDADAGGAFLLWNKVRKYDPKTGKRKLRPSRTLETRRMAEMRLFLQGYYDPTPYDPLDDKGRMAELHLSRNHKASDENIGAGAGEIRPSLKTSRTMKHTVVGQSGTAVTGAAATAGVVKVVADQASAAAESVKNAAAATGEAAKTAGETASLFVGLPLVIYLTIAIGAIVSTVSFILVRRARQDDWRRGRR